MRIGKISFFKQVNQKFPTQAQDPVNRCSFISCCLGPGAESQHKMFRRFFAVQDNCLPTPPRNEQPNHKIDPFLKWIKEVSMRAWNLAKNFSVDEQTMRMQGCHPMKLRIIYKKGEGFQCDALCDDGYTFDFLLRHKPPPRNTPTKAQLHCMHV